MSYFNSLLMFGQSLGLGSGIDGYCHMIELRLEMLLPFDVDNNRIPREDTLCVFDYGTHLGFALTGSIKSTEVTLHTLQDLTLYLRGVYTRKSYQPIEEDEELDARLEEMRQQALAADVVISEDEDDDEFQDDDDDDVDDVYALPLEDEAEDDVVTLVKPTTKKGSKKYKAEINEMVKVLNDYYGEAELESDGLDAATLAEVLDEVFANEEEFGIDVNTPLIEQLSDYIEIE